MDVSQYLDLFLDETREHLQNLSDQIMHLEEDPEDADTINEIFRAAHTLKGMAGTMGFKRMQTLTHDMENVFSEVRSGKMKVRPEIIDILFSCLDALDEYTQTIQNTSDEGTNDNEDLIKKLNDLIKASAGAAPAQEEKKSEKELTSAGESNSAGEEKWNEIPLDDALVQSIREARENGKECYGLNVVIQANCLLKSARAFLVFRSVGGKGEIIASNPSSQEIEEDRFGQDFSLLVISKQPLEAVMKAAKNVSEIASVTGGVLEMEKTKGYHAEGKKKQEPAPLPAGGEKDPSVETEKKPVTAKEKKAVPAQEKKAAPAQEKKAAPTGKSAGGKTIRVDIEKLDELMNLVSELIIAKNSLVSSTENGKLDTKSGVKENIEYLERVTTNLHESVMKVRMVPIETVTSKFPRMIRDISKKLNKRMELVMSGEETELDRTVVDEIGDPLMHLLRNSADHGLESEEVRIQRGKNPVGSIFLDAYQVGNSIVIEVRDDGNGIDVEAVKKKALERGAITPEQAETMTEKEVISLLFLPSFSTAKKVTDVSGRGVGLDVVKSKIESLSGEIEVHSRLGEGSTWTIRLPMTLAIIQVLMVSVGGEKYAISLGSIQGIEGVQPQNVKMIQNKEVINLRGNVLPLVRLNELLEVESIRKPDEEMPVVVVKKGDKYAGLVIDELLGQLEIVIKPLGKYIRQCKFFSGATILGNGEVALILDANALI